MATSQFSVLLGGDGGDEVFWGYPRFSRFSSHINWFNMPVQFRLAIAYILRQFGKDISYGISVKLIQDWVYSHHSQNGVASIEKMLPGMNNSSSVEELYGRGKIIKGKSKEL